MEYNVNFEIIEFKNIDSYKFDFNQNDNIFATGLINISKLLMINKFPIKNKNIAIKQILSFLKYIDNLLKINKGSILPIKQKDIMKYFNRNSYIGFLDLLKEMEIISKVPYKSGIFYSFENKLSKLYRIHNQYLNQDLCLVVFKNQDNIEIDFEGSYHNKFTRCLKEVDINIELAIKDEIEFTKDNNKLRSRLNRIFSLYDRRFIKPGNKVNRIYHSFSNLSRIARKHLHINNKKFNNIDVKNCQPLLLCYYLIKNNLPIDDNYLYDCQNGLLYENFTDGDPSKRDYMKVQLYKAIYFKFQKRRVINKEFKIKFPKTHSSLEKLYSDEGFELARELQNVESNIFNNLIPNKSKYFYTLFDSIYFEDEDDMVSLFNEIKKRFNVYNIKPLLTFNDISELDLEELQLIESE